MLFKSKLSIASNRNLFCSPQFRRFGKPPNSLFGVNSNKIVRFFPLNYYIWFRFRTEFGWQYVENTWVTTARRCMTMKSSVISKMKQTKCLVSYQSFQFLCSSFNELNQISIRVWKTSFGTISMNKISQHWRNWTVSSGISWLLLYVSNTFTKQYRTKVILNDGKRWRHLVLRHIRRL